MRTGILAALAAFVILAHPATPRADGIVFSPVGVSQQVEVDAQRAVIDVGADALDLIIEPVFRWTGGDGAWVVPFPALPAVSAADGDFLAELDRVTAPKYVDVCMEPSCCCDGWACDVATPGGGEAVGVDSDVTVWESGTVGDLEYVLIGAQEGDDIVQWLADNDFAVPAALGDALAAMETSGTVFFVSRVAANADPAKSLAPVRFSFPAMVQPFYPVRLTLAGLDAEAHLDVLLWLVSPAETAFLPGALDVEPATEVHYSSCDYGGYDSPENYRETIDAWFDERQEAGGGFIQEYAGVLADEAWVRGGTQWVSEYGYVPLDFEAFEVSTTGLAGVIDGDRAVVRVRGRMFPVADPQDVSFQAHDTATIAATTFYCREVGYCHTCPPCPEPDPEVSMPEGSDPGGPATPDAADEAVTATDPGTSDPAGPDATAPGTDPTGPAYAGGGDCAAGRRPAGDPKPFVVLAALLLATLRRRRGSTPGPTSRPAPS